MNHEHDENQSVISELSERLLNGIIKENPTFVLLLGMCPTLAVTTSAINGLGMGLTTMAVLAFSNLLISALRKIIPSKIRIPAFIVIIASFVTIVELLLEAYIPMLYKSLGLYIPLIVVNCIILGRAEAYAYSHKPLPSLFDGIGMGMGFTFALTIIGSLRELLGAGTIFSARVMPNGYVPVSIFIMAPGAFFVLAMLTAIQNKVKEIGEKKGKDMSLIQSGCGGNCLDCNKECKVSLTNDAPVEESEPVKNEELINEEEPVKEEEPAKEEPANEEEPVKESAPVVKEEKSDEEPVKEDKTSDDESDGIELLDIEDFKNAIKKTATTSGRKPVRKKASIEKAMGLLSKAEETLKEEEKND